MHQQRIAVKFEYHVVRAHTKHIKEPQAIVVYIEIIATLIIFMLSYNMFSCKTLVELLHADILIWHDPTNCLAK